MNTRAIETACGTAMPRARGKGSAARLMLASLVLGTMIGLGVVASLKSREAAGNPALVVQPAAGPVSTPQPVDPNRATPGSTVPYEKPQSNLTNSPGKTPADAGSTSLTKQELTNRLEQTTKLDQMKRDAELEAKAGSAAVYHDLGIVRLGGDAPLQRGQTFQLQITLEGVDTPLSSYTMEARWNPAHLQIEKIEGLKGGFTAPVQPDFSTPGAATWTASEASPSMQGDVAIALITGKVLEGSSGSTRIYLTPRTIQSLGANQMPRSTVGVGKAFGLTVE